MPVNLTLQRYVCDKCGTACIRTNSGWTCPNQAVCGARLYVVEKHIRDVEVGADAVGDDSKEYVVLCQACEGQGTLKCEECHGRGHSNCCECGHEVDCEACDGEGLVECGCGASVKGR